MSSPLVITLPHRPGAEVAGEWGAGPPALNRDTSFFNMSLRRVAWQDVLMGADTDFVGRMGPELELLLPRLDERSRRLVLGAVARAAGDGGVTAVAQAAGASWQTVADGAAELASGDDAGPGRVRRPGGGRKKLEERDPGLTAALRELLEASTRGDPQSLITWTTLSVRGIAAELTAPGTGAAGTLCCGCCTPRGSAPRGTPGLSRAGGTRTGTPSSGTSAAWRSGTWPRATR